MPWLPQTFLTLVRQTGVHPDESIDAMEAARTAGHRFLAANPDVQLHHMHDPAQDRLMLAYITYFRWKYRRLPQAYRDSILQSLEPNGTVVIVECERSWPTARVGDCYRFQFGALGGPTVEEFLHGSERAEPYLRRYRSHRRGWLPPPPDAESPEAEWGFEAALREEIAALARERGYRLVRLRFEQPEHLSPPVADLYRAWYRQRGLPDNRLLIEAFILMEPYWALRVGAVPFWMKFNMQPSLDRVRDYLADSEPFDYIHLMLFAHGVNSVGPPAIEGWRALFQLARKGGSFLEKAYPAHFAAFARYSTDLRKVAARYPAPTPLSLDRFEHFFNAAGARYPVRVDTTPGSAPPLGPQATA